MKNLHTKKSQLLILLIIIGGFLHFYNLNWGAPFYFHPDERNIASAVSQLSFPNQMNPHFFAYGSLPIYLIYFIGYLMNFFLQFLNPTVQSLNPTFDQAIIISRFFSALFATLLIPLLFFIGKKLKDENVGLLAAFLATTSIGFIQFAHFGTFEMWLTFFTTLLFWVCVTPNKKQITKRTFFLLSLLTGMLVSIKISHVIFLPFIVVFLFFFKPLTTKWYDIHHIFRTVIVSFFFLSITVVLFFMTNPFVVLETQAFQDSMRYESTLVLGSLPVFYTGEFFKTIPILFQFVNIYPFLLNPIITLLFLPALCYLLFKTIKTKKVSFILLIAFYFILFLSQAFFFAKWTRYMVPTLPFIYLISALAFNDFLNKKHAPFRAIVFTIFIALTVIFSISYFITAFVKPDTRLAAYTFAKHAIPPSATMMSEVYDLGIVPFNASFVDISLFHFYDLDNNSPIVTNTTLQSELLKSEYIVLPSQRILKPRIVNKEQFPQGNAFYTPLINGHLGYQKIYETPCDIFCKITYLGDPVFRFEETANVFDRPTVMIFKKI